ncbi:MULTISPECIES: PadR family transcriptional regulator [Amycolatopsis]|uniref:Transcriptional regulator PadR-like family protein n=2 Tax=Amycolatopsis TaxID=1813 RepID=A0A1I4BFM6_9PSEU|nr:PadR family transcriptional regulator [Amycolatopsis sacchari]SFK67645.1 Transcriptional regulator PadR-like family protein [Amycolatopsis sacchari]
MKQALTPLGMAILELLHEQPMHPYEMTQLMKRRRVDLRVKLRPGSLYHTVERLEKQGFIEVVDTQRQGRRPERTVYAMTETGRDTFAEQARDMLATIAEEYPQYPVALSALSELNPQDAIDHLKLRVMHLKGHVASDEAVVEQLLEKNLPRLYWIDHAYAHHQRKSELDWTERLIADLESGRILWPTEDKPSELPHLSIVDDKERRNA